MNRIATFYAGILLTCSVTAYSLFSCKYATQKPPLDIILRDLTSGQDRTIRDAGAKYYLIVFFSPSCPICKNMITEIYTLNRMNKINNLSVSIVLPPSCISDTLLLKSELGDTSSGISFCADQSFLLARTLGAKFTPEAFLIANTGKIVYRGALNDYYKNIGVHGVKISRHFIQEALDADVKGFQIDPSATKAIGCSIEFE